jgi:hypothetical protein
VVDGTVSCRKSPADRAEWRPPTECAPRRAGGGRACPLLAPTPVAQTAGPPAPRTGRSRHRSVARAAHAEPAGAHSGAKPPGGHTPVHPPAAAATSLLVRIRGIYPDRGAEWIDEEVPTDWFPMACANLAAGGRFLDGVEVVTWMRGLAQGGRLGRRTGRLCRPLLPRPLCRDPSCRRRPCRRSSRPCKARTPSRRRLLAQRSRPTARALHGCSAAG